MSLDVETLELVAKDGGMDYEKWPAILEPLLERLDQIVHNDFPIPRIPPHLQVSLQQSTQSAASDAARPQPPNGASIQAQPRPLPPVPSFNSSVPAPNTADVLAIQTQSTHPDTIPDLVIQQLTSITHTLRTVFHEKPPHTIQRLSELVLAPNNHYKTLPAWLRAVDRVVSVSSTANIFPLPTVQPLPPIGVIDNNLVNGVGTGTGGGGILWNNNTENRNGYDGGLGSDESLGGALLTPIPWLRNGVNHGDNDMASPRSDLLVAASEALETSARSVMVPERDDGAVTQGELIRQEQEAGIVPMSQTMRPRGEGEGEDDAMPHARGPDVVTAEDIGLVDGRNVQVQLSDDRSAVMLDEVVVRRTQPEDVEGGDSDVMLTDAVVMSEEERRKDETDEDGEKAILEALESRAT